MKKVPLLLLGASVTAVWAAWAVGCGSSPIVPPAPSPSATPSSSGTPTSGLTIAAFNGTTCQSDLTSAGACSNYTGQSGTFSTPVTFSFPAGAGNDVIFTGLDSGDGAGASANAMTMTGTYGASSNANDHYQGWVAMSLDLLLNTPGTADQSKAPYDISQNGTYNNITFWSKYTGASDLLQFRVTTTDVYGQSSLGYGYYEATSNPSYPSGGTATLQPLFDAPTAWVQVTVPISGSSMGLTMTGNGTGPAFNPKHAVEFTWIDDNSSGPSGAPATGAFDWSVTDIVMTP
jgi:hypothetical protein